nr:MAG TPA: hypothetical protein [Caudoviricetes sp.]
MHQLFIIITWRCWKFTPVRPIHYSHCARNTDQCY